MVYNDWLPFVLQLQEQTPEQLDEVSRIQDEIEETLKKYKPRGIWAAYSSKNTPLGGNMGSLLK